MFEQSENVAIAHLLGATCYEGCDLCNRFHLHMHTVLMANLAQAGCILFVHGLGLYVCEHVLLIDDHAR